MVPWLWVDEAVGPTHPRVSKVHQLYHTQQCHIVSTASGTQQPSSAHMLPGSGDQGTCGKGPRWEGGPEDCGMSMAEELTVTECAVSSAWVLLIPEHTGWPTFEPW